MSLYGKAGAAGTAASLPTSIEGSLLLTVFRWIFLYLGVATLLHWFIWGFTILRRIIPVAPPPIQDMFKIEWVIGLLACVFYLGVTIWASRKRSIPALSILIGFSIAGLACWAYLTMSAPIKRVPDQDHSALYLMAAFQSRGTAFTWLLTLAQQAGAKIASPMWRGLTITQHILTAGLCVFAMIKQPTESK